MLKGTTAANMSAAEVAPKPEEPPAEDSAVAAAVAAARKAAFSGSTAVSAPTSMNGAHAMITNQAATQLDIERALQTIDADKQKAKALGIVLEEDVDPLDAFMENTVAEEAKKEAEATRLKQEEDDKLIASGDVEALTGGDGSNYVDGKAPPDMELHCYVCKKRGHTKKDCPDRKWDLTKVGKRCAEALGLATACKHCGDLGHMIKECPAYKEDEKKKKRKKSYEVKALKRAEERKALKAQEEAMKSFGAGIQNAANDGLTAGERAARADAEQYVKDYME